MIGIDAPATPASAARRLSGSGCSTVTPTCCVRPDGTFRSLRRPRACDGSELAAAAGGLSVAAPPVSGAVSLRMHATTCTLRAGSGDGSRGVSGTLFGLWACGLSGMEVTHTDARGHCGSPFSSVGIEKRYSRPSSLHCCRIDNRPPDESGDSSKIAPSARNALVPISGRPTCILVAWMSHGG